MREKFLKVNHSFINRNTKILNALNLENDGIAIISDISVWEGKLW